MRVVMLRILNPPLLNLPILEIFNLPLNPFQQVPFVLDLFLNRMQEIIMILGHVDLAFFDGDGSAAEGLLLLGEALLQPCFDGVALGLLQRHANVFSIVLISIYEDVLSKDLGWEEIY